MPEAGSDVVTHEETPTPDEDVEVVTERNARERWRELGAVAIVAAFIIIPLRGLFRAPGPPMEEGFMLVFPERVLKGDIPNLDFLHLYGPGSLWALAGTYKVFGVSLWSERGFALAQMLAIIAAVYVLARHWNRVLAVGCAIASTLIIIPFGLTALAWVGGVGLAMLGIVSGIEARRRPDDRVAKRWAIATGVLFGCALLFRVDLIIAVTLTTVALVWGMQRARRARLLAGLGATLSLYLIHIATAGPGHVWKGMVLDPVFNLRGGRKLPLPPPWSHLDGFLQKAGALQLLSWPFPDLSDSQQIFVWFFLLFAVVGFLCWQAWQLMRRDPASTRARTLLVVAAFSVGMLPQAVQRVDSAHLAWVSCVPFAFLPVALYEFGRRHARRAREIRTAVVASAIGLLILVVVIPTFTATRYADYGLQTFGIHRHSYKIEHDGRVFYYGKEDRAAAGQLVVDAAARISKPGQRLFVGPVNLRKTPYSDAYLYYLLDDLTPGTYYIEMDPGIANSDSSGLDKQLASSDIAILSAIWDNWDEPNDSRKVGSDKAEQVLKRDFCKVGSYLGLYQLYRRCRTGS